MVYKLGRKCFWKPKPGLVSPQAVAGFGEDTNTAAGTCHWQIPTRTSPAYLQYITQPVYRYQKSIYFVPLNLVNLRSDAVFPILWISAIPLFSPSCFFKTNTTSLCQLFKRSETSMPVWRLLPLPYLF